MTVGRPSGSLNRGHVALGLVQHEVAVTLRAVEQLAVHANVIARGIGLAAQLVTTCPFTIRGPATIISSAWRRLAMPAWERIFCSRSSFAWRMRLSRRSALPDSSSRSSPPRAAARAPAPRQPQCVPAREPARPSSVAVASFRIGRTLHRLAESPPRPCRFRPRRLLLANRIQHRLADAIPADGSPSPWRVFFFAVGQFSSSQRPLWFCRFFFCFGRRLFLTPTFFVPRFFRSLRQASS